MDKETRMALEASIRHWEANLATDDPHQASYSYLDCALCQLFDNEDEVDDEGNPLDVCFKCPVMQATGESGCRNTPYARARVAISAWRRGAPKPVAEIQAEIDFLKSLLPEDEK